MSHLASKNPNCPPRSPECPHRSPQRASCGLNAVAGFLKAPTGLPKAPSGLPEALTGPQEAGLGKNPNFLEKSINPLDFWINPDFSRDFWIFGFFLEMVIDGDHTIFTSPGFFLFLIMNIIICINTTTRDPHLTQNLYSQLASYGNTNLTHFQP